MSVAGMKSIWWVLTYRKHTKEVILGNQETHLKLSREFNRNTNRKATSSWPVQIKCTLKLRFKLGHFIQFSHYHSIFPFVEQESCAGFLKPLHFTVQGKAEKLWSLFNSQRRMLFTNSGESLNSIPKSLVSHLFIHPASQPAIKIGIF